LIKIAIENQDGEVIDRVNFPSTLREVKLSQFTAFEAAMREREKFLTEWEGQDVNSPAFTLQYVEWTIKAVSEFLSTDAERFPLGDWRAYLRQMSEGKEFAYQGAEGTALSLLSNIYRLIKENKAHQDYTTDFEFSHRGEKFVCKAGYRDVITGNTVFDGMETARVLEALKMNDVYLKNRAADQNGNFFFTSLLYAIACFAQKPGEKFPDKQNEIQSFVNRRVSFFEDIDAHTGLKAAGFFLRTSEPLKRIKAKVIFGIHLRKTRGQ